MTIQITDEQIRDLIGIFQQAERNEREQLTERHNGITRAIFGEEHNARVVIWQYGGTEESSFSQPLYEVIGAYDDFLAENLDITDEVFDGVQRWIENIIPAPKRWRCASPEMHRGIER